MIISKAFRGSFVIFLISMIMMSVGSIVDGIVVGKLLSTAAIGSLAVGSAYNKLIELLSGVVATGMLNQCSKAIGCGNIDRANAVFSMSCILGAGISVIALLPVFLFPGAVASFFGANPGAADIFREAMDYIRGLGVGLPAAFGTALLLPVMQLDNEKKRAVAAVAVATVVNVSGDLLTAFVLHGGMLWIGLFTAISQYVALFILLLHFRKNRTTFRFSLQGIRVKDSGPIFKNGLPTVFNRLSTMLRNIHFNSMSFLVGGALGMSANSLVDNMSGMLGIPSKAFGSATLTIDSVLAGEEDKKALKNMLRDALLMALLVGGGLAALIACGSGILAQLYLDRSAPEFSMVTTGIFWWGLSIVPYTINLVMINYYHSIQRLVITNFLTVIENYLGPAISMVLLCPFMGMNGIWIAAFTGKLLATVLLFVVTSVRCRKIALTLSDYMYLPKSFDAETEDEIGITITTMDEVLGLSKKAISFCQEHDLDEEKAMFAGLCIEEMAAIIANKGFHDGKPHYIDIRIILKQEDVIVRMRDDCERFDPRTLQHIFNPEDPFANIGIKMLANMAKDLSYINALKLNNMIIKLER